jgi:hypothetical protein
VLVAVLVVGISAPGRRRTRPSGTGRSPGAAA